MAEFYCPVCRGVMPNPEVCAQCREFGASWIQKPIPIMPPTTIDTYAHLAKTLGQLVDSKQRQYGDSVTRSAEALKVFFPDGIKPQHYYDALIIVRVFDKISRIAQRGEDGKDLGGESPWKDISGYGLLGWWKDEGKK